MNQKCRSTMKLPTESINEDEEQCLNVIGIAVTSYCASIWPLTFSVKQNCVSNR